MIDYDLKQIRAMAFDVDGVLSTNNVYLFDQSQPCRTANIKDGYALQHAAKCGLHLAIITGGRSESVRQRYEALGIPHVFMGVSVKITTYTQWLDSLGLQPHEVLYGRRHPRLRSDAPMWPSMLSGRCSLRNTRHFALHQSTEWW